MKRIVAVCASVAALFVVAGCESPDAIHATQHQKANAIVGSIEYIKDPRTQTCFAYYDAFGYGHPTLATVPCERIPRQLLSVASPYPK